MCSICQLPRDFVSCLLSPVPCPLSHATCFLPPPSFFLSPVSRHWSPVSSRLYPVFFFLLLPTASYLLPHVSCLLACLLPVSFLAPCMSLLSFAQCFESRLKLSDVLVKLFFSFFTLQIPSMQTSLIMGSLLHRVPSLTRPRGVPFLPLRHDSMQGSDREIVTSIVNCKYIWPSKIILWVNLHTLHAFLRIN